MLKAVTRLLGRLLPWGPKRPKEAAGLYDKDAFRALVRKFQNIRYLVEQKATIDVIEKTPVAICITNEQHLYEYVNPAYCRLYGYQLEELIGKSFLIVVPEELQSEMESLHDQFMNREYELEGTWEVVTKDGSRRTILANAAYVVDEKGKPKKVTFVLDITARTDALARIDRMKNDVAGIRRKLLALAETHESECGVPLAQALKELAHEMEDCLD
jgi:PAS domain S-box-containing protein